MFQLQHENPVFRLFSDREDLAVELGHYAERITRDSQLKDTA